MPERGLSIEERVAGLEKSRDALESVLGGVPLTKLTSLKLLVFPGGEVPTRQTDGAIGYDAYARAIVDPLSKPTAEDPLRRQLADFEKSEDWPYRVDQSLQSWVGPDPENNKRYVVSLPPGERCMVGLGFATEMQFPMLYWVAPRSGFAARGITVANSPGTVDPDYRGEAGALIVNNSMEDFTISRGMRVAQVIFALALIPEITLVEEHSELGTTARAAGGFGSTGTHGGPLVTQPQA